MDTNLYSTHLSYPVFIDYWNSQQCCVLMNMHRASERFCSVIEWHKLCAGNMTRLWLELPDWIMIPVVCTTITIQQPHYSHHKSTAIELLHSCHHANGECGILNLFSLCTLTPTMINRWTVWPVHTWYAMNNKRNWNETVLLVHAVHVRMWQC